MTGPFTQYIDPGVYTRTLTDSTVVTLTGGLRIPLFIGVGDEDLQLTDYEIVRGSSASVDNYKGDEDVSAQFSGVDREIQTQLYPIVKGTGTGEISYDPNTVKVTVNGNPVGVAQLFGNTGKIVLSTIPREGDLVKVSYYFKRTDTKVENDDLSKQATGSNKIFQVTQYPVVDGTNGGIATTNVDKITVTVDGVVVTVTDLNGQEGSFELASAPANGAVVKATYWTNQWQDTFDYLPVDNVTSVTRVGTAPGRADFTNTVDFVIDGNKIQWGSSFSVAAEEVAANSNAFDDTFITANLRDNRVYLRPVSGTVNGSNKEFTLEYIPTDGSGRGTPSNSISNIKAYVGVGVADALANGEVEVAYLESSTKKVTLVDAPTAPEAVYVTYYHSFISDDIFTLTSTLPSTTTTAGEYEVSSYNNGQVLNIVEDSPSNAVSDPNFATEGVTYPNANFDGQTIPGYGVEETILLNFINNTDYLVLSSIGAEGSNGSGSLGQTYIDEKTGTRFTVMPGSTVTYQPGDLLEFDITKTFKTQQTPVWDIPGLRVTISSMDSVAAGNTAVITTYNKSGAEPDVGDFYYVSLDYAKTEYPIAVYTQLKEVVAAVGAVNTDNRLSLAAYLAFSNGAIAIALAQVLRDNTGVDATYESYKEILTQMESPIEGTGIKPNLICPITTNQEVINAVRIHCEKMSTIRYKTERTGVFGYAVGTTAEQAQAFARNMKSERLVGLYPDGAIIGLIDELGNVNEAVVDGSLLAAAYSGLVVNPTYDVATPLTHKTLTGFRRLVRQVDAVTMNQTAVAGITILEDLSPNILIRHAMTTNPDTVLTREPTVIYIKDYVQQQMRTTLDKYIGVKFLPSIIQDVETSVDNLMNQLINQEIITASTGTSATQDENDPTIMHVETYYSPVFPLNWIVVTLNLRVKL